MYRKLISYSICIALKTQAGIDFDAHKVRLCNTFNEIGICIRATDKDTKPSTIKISQIDSILTLILRHASIVRLGLDIYVDTGGTSTAQTKNIKFSELFLNSLLTEVERYTESEINFYCSDENPLLQIKKRNSIKRSLKKSLSKRSKYKKTDTDLDANISSILNTIKEVYQSKKGASTSFTSSTRNSLINLPKDSNSEDELDKLLKEL